jgi:hypothetical protein
MKLTFKIQNIAHKPSITRQNTQRNSLKPPSVFHFPMIHPSLRPALLPHHERHVVCYEEELRQTLAQQQAFLPFRKPREMMNRRNVPCGLLKYKLLIQHISLVPPDPSYQPKCQKSWYDHSRAAKEESMSARRTNIFVVASRCLLSARKSRPRQLIRMRSPGFLWVIS